MADDCPACDAKGTLRVETRRTVVWVVCGACGAEDVTDEA